MNLKSPKVTVVIPCYNDHKYIKETIDSVLSQTFKNIEVIIVDDGSNQVTKKVLASIEHPKITVLTQENGGLSNARNNGFKKAKSPYVLTIDSDDTFEPNFLQKAVTILDKQEDAIAVSSHCNIFDGNYNTIHKHTPKGGSIQNFLFDNNSTSFALIRKSIWEKVGGYDESMKKGFEDWEFWIATTKLGGKVVMIPEFLFNYRYKTISMSKDAKQNHREQNLAYIYKKHEDVYKNNFSGVVDYISELAIRHKRNELKYKNSKEYKIGRIFIYPLRVVKKIFRYKL